MVWVRWRGIGLLAIGLLGAAVAGEINAQPQGPIKLFPELQAEQGVGPAQRPAAPDAPPRGRARGPSALEDSGLPPDPDRVRVERLDAPSLDAIGLAEGLDPDIWQDSNIDRVTRLIEELPPPPANPPLVALTRRLLASGVASHESLSPGAMLARRIEQLIRLGALDQAAALLEQIPDTDSDEPVTRRAADVALWQGRTDLACELGDAVDPSAGGTFWQKLRVFCRQEAGLEDEAALGLALLRESVDLADQRFVALVEGAGDGLMTGEPWTALQVRMLAARGQTLPAPALAEPPPPLARAIADQPALAPDAAVEVAERAFLFGAIDRNRLLDLYRRGADQDAAALAPGPEARAAALQQIRAAEAPEARARVFDELWSSTPPAERVVVAYLFDTHLNALRPGPGLLFAAPSIARALLTAGYPRPAAGWLEVLQDAAANDVSAREALARIGPLFAIGSVAGGASRFDLGLLEDWRAVVDPDPLLEARLLAFAEATGGGLPLKVWWAADRRGIAAPLDLGRPVFWRIVERARAAGAAGEAVLAGLGLLGSDPTAAHPEALIAGLGAISDAGFAEEARRAATVSLIQLGL